MDGVGRMKGMTLVELLTVMMILAVLSTIAVSSYRRYLIRANRTDATTALLRIQVAEEKFFLQNNRYTDQVTADLGFASATTSGGYYTLAVAPAAGGTLATSYVATASATSKQADDTTCVSLAIDDQGQRISSPSAPSTCWH